MRATRVCRDDDGFGLVETLVAMTVLAAIALGLLAMLSGIQATAFNNRSRVVAANLAASQMDALRATAREGLDALPVAQGAVVDTVTVGGTDFDVSTTVDYLDEAGSPIGCGTPGLQEFRSVRINIAVTWNAMGSTRPVVSDSVVAPTVADLTSGAGSVIVEVTDHEGNEIPDVDVRVGGSTAETSAIGCALFPGQEPGTATVIVSKPGYVGTDGSDTVETDVAVAPGATTNVQQQLDRPARVVLTGPEVPGYPVPEVTEGVFVVGLANSDAPGGGYTEPRGSTETVFDDVFPRSGGYSAHAGPCPVLTGPVQAVAAEPGGTARMSLDYRQIDVRVQYRRGGGLRDFTGPLAVELQAEERDDCPTVTYRIGAESSPVQAVARASMPSGVFDILVKCKAPGAGWQSARLEKVGLQASDAGVLDLPVQIDACAPGRDDDNDD